MTELCTYFVLFLLSLCSHHQSAPAGFTLVGHGGCRDGTGTEPPFFTNEEGAGGRPPAGSEMSAAACTAACAADSTCTAFATAQTSSAAEGACHLYDSNGGKTAPAVPPPGSSGAWSFQASAGNPNNVTSVHAGEPWWSCFRKSPGTNQKKSTAGVVQHYFLEDAHLHAQPVPNVSSGFFGAEFVEAPALFKRKGVYYALFGKCCCFCGHGSGSGVYTSTTSPLGPWTYHDNIACIDAKSKGVSSVCGCGMNSMDKQLKCPDLYGDSATKAQQNFVFPVQGSGGANSELTYVWTGDMWQSGRSGLKSDDRQFWTPLTFVKDPASGIELPLPIDPSLQSFVLNVA